MSSIDANFLESIPLDLRDSVALWLAQDGNDETRMEIIELCKDKNWAELHKRLDTRILFGTAGLRSRMEAGFSRMNTLVVLQATQGLVRYIKNQYPDNLVAVVGHDHRYYSKEFASATAATFLEAGYKVYYLNEGDTFVHTPMVPFTVNQVNASVGVMITASHNPKMDNGYKVYYSNGCQIISPHDKGIAHSIDENLNPWPNAWKWNKTISKGLENGSLIYARKEMTSLYVKKMGTSLVDKDNKILLKKGKPWFVYTPMHGVGYDIFHEIASKILGLKADEDFYGVKEQLYPDPGFPTVSFPNPEEAGALDLAIRLADSNGIALAIANDPDADRFSAAIKDDRTGAWKQLTGNEIGFLFASYEFQKYRERATRCPSLQPLAMLNSTVSSQMIKKMAEKEGFHFEETLTGFKWIGNRAFDLEKRGFYVPFGFEEAIGYMFPIMEHDKDGVSAAIVFLQAYIEWSQNQKNPLDILEDGFQLYGVFKEKNGYYLVNEPSMIQKVFDYIRNDYTPAQSLYPQLIGEELSVITFRDLTVGFQSDTNDHKPTLPTDPSSQMITVTARPIDDAESSESVRFTIRGSGTEPKLKVYIEAIAQSETRANELAHLTWNVLQKEWFRPEATGLTTTF